MKREIANLEYRLATTGPRGGEIIGETKSGKAIYDTRNHPAHKDFTEDDHKDAMHAHADKMVQSRGKARERFVELSKGQMPGGGLEKAKTDPEYQKHLKDEQHHSKMIDRHSGLFD